MNVSAAVEGLMRVPVVHSAARWDGHTKSNEKGWGSTNHGAGMTAGSWPWRKEGTLGLNAFSLGYHYHPWICQVGRGGHLLACSMMEPGSYTEPSAGC